MNALFFKALALAALIPLAACGGDALDGPTSADPQPPTTTTPPTQDPTAPADPPADPAVDPTTGMPDDPWHTGVGTTPPAEAALTPPPSPLERPRRRMDVDQLKRAFYKVTGGIGWTRLSGGVEIDRFDDFSATLGKPDYLNSTLEDLTPGALFQKFLGDAAREVCARWLDRELETDPAERTFFTKVSPQASPAQDLDGIVDNLVALKLRVHGQDVSPTHPSLEQLVWLFESGHHISNDVMTAWNTTCVGLFTHPDFYTF